MSGAPGLELPPIIGHRGAAALAPENTLAGLRAAARAGLLWVEFDVRLTSDRRCILLHDDAIDRTTDGTGLAADFSLAELSVWDAGGWFSEEYSGERIPTLEEAVDQLTVLGLGANVEIKANRGEERETGLAVASLLEASWPSDLPPPLISSFSPESLAGARDGAPGLARGLLVGAPGDRWRETARALACSSLHCDHAHLSKPKAREIAAAGLTLLAYTVDHAGRAEELWSWGVASIFTDAPGRVSQPAATRLPLGAAAAIDAPERRPSPCSPAKPYIAEASLPRGTVGKLGPGVQE